MASVLPRRASDGSVTWRVQFRIDGRMRQETFTAEKGAREFGRLVDTVGGEAARKVLEARRGRDEGVPTLREWTAEYLDPASGILTGVEPGTRADYVKNADRSFLQVLGDLPVDAITKADVGRWVEWQERQGSRRREGPIAAKTVRNYHALLSSILAAAVEHKHAGSNPAHRTRLTKGQKREGVFLSRAEFQTLLDAAPARYQPFVLFLAGTGCRWGEATALTWGDINTDVSPATARISKAWKKTAGGPAVLGLPKSSRSRRTVSLWPELVDLLGERGPSDALVFAAPRGGKLWPGWFSDRVWKPTVLAAKDAGLAKSPNVHDLRHTHASWLIASGAPLPFVQARLGHESITTTINTYGHLLPDAHVQMSGIMQDALAGALSSPLALGR